MKTRGATTKKWNESGGQRKCLVHDGSSIMKIHAGMPMESDIETIGSTKNTNANEK